MKTISVACCVMLIVTAILPHSSRALGPLVKVCGSRELKEVTESVCSTLGKRDISFYASSMFGQRLKRISAEEMGVKCCREACTLAYYTLFCD